MIKKIIDFITHDVWAMDVKGLPKYQQFLYRQIRVFGLAFRGFQEDDCMVRSSALTYYTMLSIVPVFAMLFGIAKGFGMEEKLNEVITSQLSGQKEVLENVLTFSHNLLENTQGGLVAGAGVALLLWSVIKVMSNVELSFNAIWAIKKERSLVRKFTEYLSFMLLAPVMIIIASSATVIISAYVKEIGDWVGMPGLFEEGVSLSMNMLPYVMMWLLFAFLYVAMPNTKVNLKSAIPAAIIAGSVFQLTQWAYFNLQIGAVKYNAIYGSFAALPLFLVWLQTSWMIVLFGGELAFSNQNHEQYEFEAEIDDASALYRKKTAITILHFIIKRFENGQEAASIDTICQDLKVPYRLAKANINDLILAKVVAEGVGNDKTGTQYLPAISINKLSIEFVLEALDRSGQNKLPSPNSEAFSVIDNNVNQFYNKLKELPENKLLKDI